MVALGLVGGRMPDAAADGLVAGLGPDQNLFLYQIAQGLIGVAFMFYLIDYSSSLTNAYMLVAGVVLVLLTLFAPQGLAGTFRTKAAPWLP